MLKNDLAISFAEEDIGIARTIHNALKKIDKSLKVYLYKEVQNLTHDLEAQSRQIYQYETRHAAVILSENYFKENKKWTKKEFDAILQKTRMLRGVYGNQYKFLILICVGGFQMNSVKEHLANWGYSEEEATTFVPLLSNTVRHEWKGNNEKLARSIYYIVRPRKRYKFIVLASIIFLFLSVFMGVLFWRSQDLPNSEILKKREPIGDLKVVEKPIVNDTSSTAKNKKNKERPGRENQSFELSVYAGGVIKAKIDQEEPEYVRQSEHFLSFRVSEGLQKIQLYDYKDDLIFEKELTLSKKIPTLRVQSQNDFLYGPLDKKPKR